MKLPKDFDPDALCRVAYRARLATRYPREMRAHAIKQRAGFYYSTNSCLMPMPINMLEMVHTIVGGRLISNNPQVSISTDLFEAKPVADAVESWVNKQIVRIRLRETLERSATDAIDWFGIVMVALATPGTAAMTGWNIKAGEPYAEGVDPDDYIWSLHARRMDQPAWEGHRFRIPLIVAKKMYGKEGRSLEADTDRLYNLEGDERASTISRTTLLGEEELEDMVDLWHFWIPRHRICVILRDDDLAGSLSSERRGKNIGRVLDAYNWIGPDMGPYHKFILKNVANNSMPKGPIQDYLDLNESINVIARKLMRQGDRQKEVLAAAKAAAKDAETTMKTNDGEVALIDRPDLLKQVFWGGPNQQNFQLLNAFIDRLSWLAGNLEIQGGLGPQSGTAKQDELLNENSSQTTQNMQQRMMNGVISVVNALSWFWYHDPYKVMNVTFSLPGSPAVTAPLQVHPHPGSQPMDPNKKYRVWKYEDLNLHIDPFTVQYQSPQQRQQAIDSIVTQIIIPMMGILQAQGVQFDIRTYLQKKAKMQQLPDLMELVKMVRTQVTGTSPDQQQGSDQSTPVKPATTNRNYTRRSEPGTNAGQQMQYANHMNGQQGIQNVK